VKLFLVRHARAQKRSKWTEADELRPLDERGERQARGIQELLRDVPLRRVCSSPALRCRQTVDGLAVEHVLELETDARLGEDSKGRVQAAEALRLLSERGRDPVVVCAGRSLIHELLQVLGVSRDAATELRCQKGSVWVVDRRGGKVVRAEYVAPREGERGERRAVLDIGSTSMSLLVADVGPEPSRIHPILRTRAELRLGASAKEIGAVDKDRLIKLGRSMRAEAKDAGSSELLSVATASLRNATNGIQVAESLNEVLGSRLRILSGPEEAEIVFRAARQRLGLESRRAIVIDLGGGSLDFALGRGEKMLYAASEPLGVTRLHAEYVREDPMTRSERNAIRKRVRARLAPHLDRLSGRKKPRFAAAGGSIRTLAKLIEIERTGKKPASVCGLRILRAELQAIGDKLHRSHHAERVSMPGMQTQRADLLPTAAIILLEFLEQLEIPELRVSDWGLREGLLLPDAAARGHLS
jgi:exopolyphosphatase / guanosine-5'-triphosphate,3'-diphosphate pyrophosphatase